jgi:hypothetical protein
LGLEALAVFLVQAVSAASAVEALLAESVVSSVSEVLADYLVQV